MKIKQANKKKTEPNIAQKLPTDAIQNPIADRTNRIQPIKLMPLLLICPILFADWIYLCILEIKHLFRSCNTSKGILKCLTTILV